MDGLGVVGSKRVDVAPWGWAMTLLSSPRVGKEVWIVPLASLTGTSRTARRTASDILNTATSICAVPLAMHALLVVSVFACARCRVSRVTCEWVLPTP